MKVRLKLESLSTSPVIDENRYRLLSERTVHVHPETTPQSHNVLGIPVAGSSLQEAGLLVCLNELALPLSLAMGFSACLLDLEKDTVERIVLTTRNLIEQIGRADITEIDDYHRKARKNPMVAEKLELIKQTFRTIQSERHR